MRITKIAVIGAGTMGANIALNFAAHGHEVHLHDSQPGQLDKALQTVRANTELLIRHGLLSETVAAVVSRIVCEPGLEPAAREADLVIEAVPEKLELKRRIFEQLAQVCRPEAILASNTSSFVPSLIAGMLDAGRVKRFLVMHYWNPAHLIPLVELVPHPQTDASVLAGVKVLLGHCGKSPVVLRKEEPGFIGNRLAFALQREAMNLVERGVASQEDIDTVVKTSFGRRMPVSGVFGTADLGGLDVYLEICNSLFPHLCNESSAPAMLKRLVEQGDLGAKTGAGWSKYTPDQIAALRQSMTEELIHQLKRDQGAGEA